MKAPERVGEIARVKNADFFYPGKPRSSEDRALPGWGLSKGLV
jgi:hypothetical protein